MKKIKNNSNNNRKKIKKNTKYDEIEQDVVSIKSSKKDFRIRENSTKSKKEIKREKKKIRRDEKRKKVRAFFLKLFLITLIIITIIGICFYKKTQLNGGGARGALITAFGLSVEKVESLDTINILLLGVSEDIESKLTDTIILCSYNPKKQSASMISIPRDTFIGKSESTAKGSDKINSLYSKSPEKLLTTVSRVTGIDVNYYAVVKTQALIEIVNIIGGVNFEVPIDMDYDDPTQDLHIHLKKGMQKINGEEAEQLLRFRHNNDGTSYPASYGDNDYGRMKTQRDFITQAAKQTIIFKNIFKAKNIIDTIFENIETNLELNHLLPYLPTAIDFNIDSIVSNQLPGISKKCNDLWFFVYDEKETKKLVKELELISES
ncbi:MAG: LCP family protein [Clostridia bacterium]|nr:LCP family protein [Clostridia bacterium]